MENMVHAGKALIVGAGPAGLSAGISLNKAGFKVDILEKTPDREVLGSELHIPSAALRTLDSLGAAESVVAAGVPIEQVQFLSREGDLIAGIPLTKVTRDDLPTSVGMTRSALHAAIYDSAAGLGIDIAHDVSVDSIVDDGGGVQVTRTDGAIGHYDFVIGADGVASRVRQLRFPKVEPPPYSGQCVWRASVPRKTDPGLFGAVGQNGVFVGMITVSDEESYIFSLTSHETPPRPDPTNYVALVHETLSGLGGPLGDARALIDGSRTIHFSPMWAGMMPLPWSDGRALLIGDAAHATTPHLGYGAGLAIEDGAVLGPVMRDAPDVATGFLTFGKLRYERCAMVVETALRICKWQQKPESGFDQAAESAIVWNQLAEPI